MRSSAATDWMIDFGSTPSSSATIASGLATSGDATATTMNFSSPVLSSGTHLPETCPRSPPSTSAGGAGYRARSDARARPASCAGGRALATRPRGRRSPARRGSSRAGHPHHLGAQRLGRSGRRSAFPSATSSSPLAWAWPLPPRAYFYAIVTSLQEVPVLDRVQQLHAFLERTLERLATRDQTHAAGALVDHRRPDRVVQIVVARCAAAVDETDLAHVAVHELPAAPVDRVVGRQLAVDLLVRLAEALERGVVVAAVQLGELLLDDVGLDRDAEGGWPWPVRSADSDSSPSGVLNDALRT